MLKCLPHKRMHMRMLVLGMLLTATLAPSVLADVQWEEDGWLATIGLEHLEDGDEFYVVVAALADSVENWDFTTFLSDDESLSDSVYVSDPNFIISRKVEDGKIEIPIQAFLQSYKNDIISNHGLMLYSGPVNSPFDKVRLDMDSVEVLYVKP